MRPKRSGTIFRYIPARDGERHGHFVVRCTAPDGSRPLFHLDPGPKSKVAELSALETAAGLTEQLWSQGLGGLPQRVTAKRPRQATEPGADMTAWLDAWARDRARRGISPTHNLTHWREHIAPVIPGHVQSWTQEDLRRLSLALDEKVQSDRLAWKTVQNVWATATKMTKDACSHKVDAIRVRSDNPAVGVLGPDRGARTEKQYLYPSEFAAFAACESVPVGWRRAVALAIYAFPRASELRALSWDDVDLDHGMVHIHQAMDRETGRLKSTKSRVARRFALEPALLPMLRVMHEESGGKGPVMPLAASSIDQRKLAHELRRGLAQAGVLRAELHESTPTRKSLTFHDLRATGLTWMAVRGDDPLKIMQRAGHTDFKTTQAYVRTAEAVREGFGDVFPPLPEGLLVATTVTRTVTGGGSSRKHSRSAGAPTPRRLSGDLNRSLKGCPGRRCTAKAFLQYDHTFARGRGGGGGPDNISEMCFGHNQLRAEEEYGPEFIADKAVARKSRTKSRSRTGSNTGDTEAKRPSGSGNHPCQQRCRTEEEATVFDKLHKALVGLGFQRKQATEAIEHIAKQCPLAETPVDQLLRRALGVLVPFSSGGPRR